MSERGINTTTIPETIGIVGGGQLGRMLTVPAKQLGFEVVVLDPSPDCPASRVGAKQIKGSLTDPECLGTIAEECDVLTIEIEHVGVSALRALQEKGYNIQPSPDWLDVVVDKYTQKEMLTNLDIPTAPYSETLDEDNFMGDGPYVVKSRKGGFDGRGNLIVDSFSDPKIAETFRNIPVYAEQVVNFDKEISVVAAKARNKGLALYPIVETVHKNNICHTATSPAEIEKKVAQKACTIVRKLGLQNIGAGVFAVEMFVIGDDVLVNEIAPRVHNSGHLTIEANRTSQFEQHIRAITGLPLGPTSMIYPFASMVNVLGSKTSETIERTGLEKALKIPGVSLHLYEKIPKPSRKIGHITAVGDTRNEVIEAAASARKLLTEL